MPRPTPRPALVAGTLLAAAVLLPSPAAALNFLVIVADDLGADKVATFADYSGGRFGGQFLPATPTLDDLASAGLAFSDAWANPLCSPTRAGLYTGNFPSTAGVGQTVSTLDDPPLPTDAVTLAEALADVGYETALVGKWHLGFEGSAGRLEWDTSVACADGYEEIGEDPNPVVQGFGYFAGSLGGALEDYTEWTYATSEGAGATRLCVESAEWADDAYANAAVSWINARSGPFFAVVAFNSPHTDDGGQYLFREWDDLSAACQAGVAKADACISSESCGDADGDGVDDSQDLLYRYQVECLDTTIGGMLAGIDPALLADTLVVFLGDNGTPGNTTSTVNLLEDPYTRSVSSISGSARYGKGTALTSGVRVPFLVVDGANWLELQAGSPLTDGVVRTPGRLATRPIVVEDVFDTFLALAGAPALETDGADFSDCLQNPSGRCAAATLATRPQYAEAYRYSDLGALESAVATLAVGAYRIVAENDATNGCVSPSIYAMSDRFDEHDLFETIGPFTVYRLERAIAELATWMPRADTGRVNWCR